MENMNMDGLKDLMGKIEEAMEASYQQQVNIDTKTNELYQETRVMMVEKGKEELETLKQNKKEYDEMTVNALKDAKKAILTIRKDSEDKYQEMLLSTIQKRKDIENKLAKMRAGETKPEKLTMIENSAAKALEKVNADMKEFQDNHFEKMALLDKYENNINRYAMELNAENELDNVKIEEEIKKENNQENKEPEAKNGPENKKETENKKGPEDKKSDNGKKVYDWHPKLTQEQKDELIAEGLKPGDPEYFLSLRNYGIKDDGPFHYENDKTKGPKPAPGKPSPEKPKPGPEKPKDDGFYPPAVIDKDKDKFQPPAVIDKDKDKFQPPAVIEKPKQNLPAKTGLQIFRDEFNKMPDIKNRHTLTERLPLATTLGTVAGFGLLGINPLIGAPIAAASLLAKPIAYRLTGQKKLESEITKQLLDMKPEDLEKMVDYLSEENIQDLKPNAVILRSLNKAMIQVTRQNSQKLQNEMTNLQDERQELYNKGNLSAVENKRLMEINDRIQAINEVEAPKVERRLKEVKRGKDRVSQRYKGNLATRFNIFAHRNTTSEEYYPKINQYANGEMFRDVAKAEGNAKSQAEGQMLMEKTMEENTHKNFLGIQNSVFNKRNNVVRIMSDRLDNTVRYVGRIGTIAAGTVLAGLKLKEFENAQDVNATEHSKVVSEHNQDVQGLEDLKTAKSEITNGGNITPELAQKVADEQRTIAGAYGESAALHNTGSTRAANYLEQDQLTQDQLANVGKTISEKNTSGILHQLSEAVKSRSAATTRLENEAMDKIGANTWRVDHTEQLESQVQATEQADATATLYENMAKVIEKIEKIEIPSMSTVQDKFVKVANSFAGPILAGLGFGHEMGKDMSDSSKEKRHNRAANEIEEDEELEQ